MNKRLIILIIVLLIVFLASCNSSKEINNFFLYEKNFYVDSLSSNESFYYSVNEIDNQEYLLRINDEMNSIDFFSFKELKFTNRMMFDFDIMGYVFFSDTSFLVKEFQTNEIVKTNNNLEILKKYNFHNKINNDSIGYVSYSLAKFPLYFENNLLIFNITAKISPPGFFNSLNVGTYNIATKEINKFAPFPDKIRLDTLNQWIDFEPSYCLNDDNQLVVGFGIVDELDIYDLSGKHLKSVIAKSKFVEKFIPLDKNAPRTRKTSMKYSITRNKYVSIIYDKYRNLYYRIVQLGQELENDDGTINDFGENPWSIIVMDEDFEVIDEIKMPRKIHNFNEIMVCREGLLVRKHRRDDDEPNTLKYDIIKMEISHD